jgi:hypothetical protein
MSEFDLSENLFSPIFRTNSSALKTIGELASLFRRDFDQKKPKNKTKTRIFPETLNI